MKKEWVVVLGAGKSQLALIKNAKSLGYKVLAIDQIDALIISSINLNDNISKFLMDIGVDKEKIVSLY